MDVNTAFLTASGLAVGDTATVDTVARAAQVTVRIVGEVFQPVQQPQAVRQRADAARLRHAMRTCSSTTWGCGRAPARPGTSRRCNQALGPGSPWLAARPQDGGQFYTIASGLVGLLALMVAVAAGLGVLNTVLMTTRDRVHDLGIFKALGMRPGQMLAMVVCWIAGPAVVAAAIAAPAAVALNTATVHAMAGTAHTGIPASFTQVFPPPGWRCCRWPRWLIAVAGALLPGELGRPRPPGRGPARRVTGERCIGTVPAAGSAAVS